MDTVYDRALLEVGDDGYFQKKFDLIYNIVLPFFWIMAYMNILSVLAVIPHMCKLPNKPDNVSALAWQNKFIPTYKDAIGRIERDSCLIYANPDVNNETKRCERYTYDTTWYESTVSSDNDWVCDNELYVANVFSCSKAGEIAGALIFGWFGDTYGRRITYIIAMALIVLGRIVSILGRQSFIFFASGTAISCLSTWTVVQNTYVISMEISAPNRRAVVTTLRNVSVSLGLCTLPILYWWLRDWKLFMMITTATQLPFLFFSWNILESPRWSWISGKPDECVKNLKRIAVVNKSKISPETENEILQMLPTGKTISLGVLALFAHWRLAANTILQLFISFMVTMTYTVLLMNPAQKSDGNPFLESASQSLAEIPGYFLGALLAERLGRRYASCTSFAVSTISWAIVAFREHSTNDLVRSEWIETTLFFSNRLFLTISYYIISIFNMEIYPTCIRQSGISLGNVVSSGGAAMAPYVLYLGRHVDPRLPGGILAGASVIGLISSLLLPETLNTKLPETLEDAQQFGKKYSSLSKQPRGPEDLAVE